jgi:hypothetical protein
MADTLNCEFVDLAGTVEPSPRDPWHWEAEGHAAAAQVIGAKVREMFP